MKTAPATPGRSSAGKPVSRPEWEEEVTWQDQALCRGADPNLFFAPQTAETKEEKAAREALAKEICARCPVRRQCLAFALATREPFGIWGGLNESERRQQLHRRAG